mmetsp:Transcript_111/g.271  ORF Transcript_111/g.271 Transcript_111/m.271 type:complete len:424 (+) Transcript_111:240-1511(+)|eukprot:CAMPEP_0171438866 /NCGR_PEP_ID=MMETSP0881-20121228/19051_1 /TAXON_ID=67004 /ORGANISM="Thalassiosira weissflogii, Strain CCMP1336" /LENGTH=423 /DNA_ID=CAMNT_0011960859 /DNA_START=206 /DNA_END=1474 /DNA_ORIENTATION=+
MKNGCIILAALAVSMLLALLEVINSTSLLSSTTKQTMFYFTHDIGNMEKSDPSQIYDENGEDTLTVDLLSVASQQQLSLLLAQKSTVGSHTSVRNFFNATELDDADPSCSSNLKLEDVKSISSFCRRRGDGLSEIFRVMRGNYARWQWLEKKRNPMGWMCAQVRPISGLFKIYNHFMQTREDLPDYLIVMDDDTYFNMEMFQESFQSFDSSINMYYAGCLVRSPIHQINFTFPFGGYGSILSRGTLVNLFRPIHCAFTNRSISPSFDITTNTATNKNFTYDPEAICTRIKEDNVGEKRYFRNGMNIVQLMYAYSSSERYVNIKNWTSGFCMHSDWAVGYFMNFYNVSMHVKEAFYKDVPHARIEAYKGSEIYRKGTGLCNNENDCPEDSEICHRASADWMRNETNRWKLKFPKKFLNLSAIAL